MMNNSFRRQSLRPDNEESTDDLEQEKANMEEYEEHQRNVHDLEHLLQRRQQASKILMKGYDGIEFDMNMFLGIEQEMNRSEELNAYVKRVDTLIGAHVKKMEKTTTVATFDERSYLPVFTRSTTQFLTTKFLASIQFDYCGRKTSKTLNASGDMTPDTLIAQFFQKQLTNKAFDDLGDTTPKQWTLKGMLLTIVLLLLVSLLLTLL
jgi:hypothetical protein